MNRILLSSVSILIGLTLLLSFSGGPGTVGGVAGTLAPGESGTWCGVSSCHGTINFENMTNIEIRDANDDLVSNYIPGETYTVNVIINAGDGTPGGYGFQMVALENGGDTDVGNWQNLPSGIQSVTQLDRAYVEHQGARTEDNTFSVEWTAPAAGTGDITFYAAGNAVNRNGGRTGDGADTTQFVMGEELISSLFDNPFQASLNIFPNPSSDYVLVEAMKDFQGTAEIHNLQGQLVQRYFQVQNDTRLDISEYKAGMYILYLYNNDTGQIASTKLSKS